MKYCQFGYLLRQTKRENVMLVVTCNGPDVHMYVSPGRMSRVVLAGGDHRIDSSLRGPKSSPVGPKTRETCMKVRSEVSVRFNPRVSTL